MSTADEPDLVGADATDVETPPPLAVVPRPQPRTPAVRRPRTPAPVPRMEHDVANVADGGSSPPGGTTRAAGDGARRTCTAPAGAGLGLQNPRRRVRFPGGVRRHVGDEHMPPSRGWTRRYERRWRGFESFRWHDTHDTQRPRARASGSYPREEGSTPSAATLGVPICTSSPGDGPHMDGYWSYWFDSNRPDQLRLRLAGVAQR